MKCKLICSDIDGTLLDINRSLSIETKKAVKKISPEIPFILVSSRMPKSMHLLQAELQINSLPLIAYNGALILDGSGKVLKSIEIPFSITKQICTHLTNSDLHFSFYNNAEWVVPALDFWAKREQNNTRVTPNVRPLKETLALWSQKKQGAHKIMAMGESVDLDQIEQFLFKNFSEQINAYRSKDTYLEISNKELDKASALAFLLSVEYPDINMQDIMAFGDNYNDQTLLELAGRGVAVSNAKSEILKATPFHTLSNHEHGVAVAIEKYY
tara:strand:+ start:4815 stop:5624 length:810 start_codon:yes stop_codon:yes gene_type:complete